ncbi:protein NODULATION SIGNALING PATHWAY 2 [Manihot esculenta]|uniref:Uncharacterized protein n=1 Tax=Manihot esculenta TaxID=3983 RepID=A0A2C9VEV3_MANES|nr:protein NODULATION SIGNALING PATHWAY 2 [Manihot esculenta]OAY43756.1 hypothetical protein MANES_08G095400v8 [Manihot esculenta]
MLESQLFHVPFLHDSNNEVELFLDDQYPNYALGINARVHQSELSPTFPSNAQFVDDMNLEFLLDELPFALEESDLFWKEMQDIFEWLKIADCSGGKNNDECCNHRPLIVSGCTSMDRLVQRPLTIPNEGFEISFQVSMNHLAKAYGEAMENNQAELAEVIMRRISEKVSPIGEIRERVLYYAFQQFSDNKKQADYIKQESCRNFVTAFMAFYQIFPYGMIAHFTANSAILEAKPEHFQVLHVVDFDMGEGVQWSSLIMSLPQHITLKLTAIKWREEDSDSGRKFTETRRQLQDFSGSIGIRLHVEEMEIQDLAKEMKRKTKNGGKREWLAFNCMWALPHMGKRRSSRQVMEFLAVAKDVIADSATNNKGIVTLGDGGDWQTMKNCNAFGPFFECCMGRYEALLESMELNLPVRLAEARLSMECLFISPYVSFVTLMQTWGDVKEGSCDFMKGLGFEGLMMNNRSLMEAKEMVRQGETPYGVRTDNNEIVLEWKGIPLVRVSSWR